LIQHQIHRRHVTFDDPQPFIFATNWLTEMAEKHCDNAADAATEIDAIYRRAPPMLTEVPNGAFRHSLEQGSFLGIATVNAID